MAWLGRIGVALFALFALGACDPAGARDTGVRDAGGTRDGGTADAATPSDAGGEDAALADAGPGSADAGEDAGRPPPCEFDDPRPPPAAVRWPSVLSADGAATLGGHGHDDGLGPVGFCAGARVPGAPFYRLVAAGFESDEDRNGDGDQADALRPGFHEAEPFDGVGESAGRINVYVDVLDEAGRPLSRDSAPDLALVREQRGGETLRIPLDAKPPNEFQTNFPMTGGGARYGVAVEGASDRVVNLRLPVNHHVTYVLVFQREPAG